MESAQQLILNHDPNIHKYLLYVYFLGPRDQETIFPYRNYTPNLAIGKT
jgi:hypothetical protein